MVRFTCCALALLSAALASAQEVVLRSPERALEIKMVPLPEGPSDRFLVAWSKLTEGPQAGALVFRREADVAERRFFAVGQVGSFALVERGESTLVAGTLVPVYRLIGKDPNHPVELRVVGAEHPNPDELRAAYQQGQGLAAPGATRAQVQAALASAATAFQAACGAKPELDVAWKEFERPGRLPLASTLAAAVLGIADACNDPAYRAEIVKHKTFRERFAPPAAGDALGMRLSDSAVELKLNAEVSNPRQRAAAWITSAL